MSIFSNKLKKYVEQKNMPVYALAKGCDMDRSVMYKIVHGTRGTSSKQVVERIARVLELTPHEKKQLLEAWRITAVGEYIYFERKIITEFIENLRPEKKIFCENYKEVQGENFLLEQEIVLFGKNNLNICLKMLIEEEMRQSLPIFRVACQPEMSFLFEMLAVFCADRAECEVRHLICMEGSSEKEENRYNLCCLKRMIPLLKSSCKYEVHYYYDSVQSHFYNMNLLPHVFLTETYVVQISSDFECGICSKMPEKIEVFRKLFEDYMNQTEKLFIDGTDAEDIIDEYGARSIRQNKITAVLTPAPIPGSISEDIIEKNLKLQSPETIKLKTFFSSIQDYCQICIDSDEYQNFFTEEGIRDFMDYGHIVDPMADYFENLSLEDRMASLKKMQKMMESNTVRAYLIRPGLLNMPSDFYMTIYENGQSDIIFRTSGGQWRILKINERSLGVSFKNFIKYLPECKEVCSLEESCTFIKKIVKEYTFRFGLDRHERVEK